MTESTSDAPPSVWFPSVLEYGGGTMHHAALRGDVEIEVWAELRPRMMEWCASHSADVEEGRLVEPFTTDEQARQSRSLFSGDRPPPSDGELPGL